MNHQDNKQTIEPVPYSLDQIARQVVSAACNVHSSLGPGLLESVYEACLAHEVGKRGLSVRRQVPVPVNYDNVRLDLGFRLDLVVKEALIVEIKAVDALHPVHYAQMITYLKLTNLRLGLLINFNVPLIKEGIHRIAL
ncbi:MAG TPA: GxxExxY protein [Acidobacteriota bacterium]|jgi:GxxExxY protein